MIGEFFSISATNIGHAAIAAASRPFPEDAPATIELAMRKEDSGREEVYIGVRTLGASLATSASARPRSGRS